MPHRDRDHKYVNIFSRLSFILSFCLFLSWFLLLIALHCRDYPSQCHQHALCNDSLVENVGCQCLKGFNGDGTQCIGKLRKVCHKVDLWLTLDLTKVGDSHVADMINYSFYDSWDKKIPIWDHFCWNQSILLNTCKMVSKTFVDP